MYYATIIYEAGMFNIHWSVAVFVLGLSVILLEAVFTVRQRGGHHPYSAFAALVCWAACFIYWSVELYIWIT